MNFNNRTKLSLSSMIVFIAITCVFFAVSKTLWDVQSRSREISDLELFVANWGGRIEIFPGGESDPSIDLNCSVIDDEGLLKLSSFPAFRRASSLLLSRTKITDLGLNSLKSCPDLVALDVSGTSITDAGLATIPYVPSIQILNLSDTVISDFGLETIKKLPCRDILQIMHTERTKVTPTGKSALSSYFIKLQIK